MATVSRTFSVRNGLDVANTIVLDSNRNLSNIVNVNATSFVTSAGLNLTDQANNAYAAANAAANTVRISANGGSTLSGKQLNFVNTATSLITLSDAGNGNANIEISVIGGGAIGQAFDQANAARDQANTARGTANDAYGAANTANTNALNAYGQANAAYGQANAAYGQANAAYLQANNAYSEANLKLNISGGTVTGNLAVARDSKANTFVATSGNVVPPNLANTHGERLRLYDFEQAGHPNYAIGVEGNHIWTGVDDNTGATGFKWYGNTTQAAVLFSNGSLVVSNTVEAKTFLTSGGLDVTGQANAARDQANTARDSANSAANTVRVSANGSSTLSSKQLNFVNTASIQVSVGDAGDGNANITFTTSGASVGDAYAQANDAYGQANTARNTANDAYAQANAGYAQANTARGTANDAYAQANAGYAQANTARNTANDAYAQANTARTTANDAYGQANAAYGQANNAYAEANLKLNLTGGTINGSLNVSGNLTVTGNTSYINVTTLNVADPLIFLAANNDTSDVVDIGFIGSKNSGPGITHTGLVRDAGDGTYYLFDNLVDAGHANNVLDFANSTLAILRANINANSILLTGNAVATQANLTLAHDQANAARGQANTAYGQANDAFGAANNRVLKAGDTMTGALTITTSGIGLTVANANVTFSLQVGTLNVTTNTVTTATSGQVVLDKFPTTQLASAKYFVQANSGTDYTVTEVVVVQDGTNIFLTEYGTIQSGPSLGTFSADVDTGDVRLLFTANNNVNTIRSIRYGVLPP